MNDVAEKDQHGLGAARLQTASPDARALVARPVCGRLDARAGRWVQPHPHRLGAQALRGRQSNSYAAMGRRPEISQVFPQKSQGRSSPP